MTNFKFKDIEDYVNESVAAYALPIANIESIKCRRMNDKVYIELVHESGTARYFDASGLDTSGIGIMVGHIIANKRVYNEISGKEARKAIRRIFR